MFTMRLPHRLPLVPTAMVAAALCLPLALPAETTELIASIKEGDQASAKSLIEARESLDAAEVDGSTALHWAIEYGETELALMLIDAGADLTAANRFNVTPLSLAAKHGNAEVIERLMQAGVDPNSRSLEGEPALMTAAANGKVEALRALLRNGADIHVTEPVRGQTPLMWAAGNGNAAATELLVEFGANLHEKSEGGYTALMLAVVNGHLEAADALLKLGANVQDAAPDGTAVLTLAILNADYDMGSLLLDHGADPNAPDPRTSALHSLIFMRKPGSSWEAAATATEPIPVPRPIGEVTALQLAEKLLEHGADPNRLIDWKEQRMSVSLGTTRNPPNINLGRHHVSLVGASPFYSAARNGDAPMMRLLVEHGADPNVATEVGVTPLMAAACIDYYEGESPGPTTGVSEAERLEAVKLAIELGNDPNAKTHLGDYPMIGSAEFTLLTYPENMDDLLDLGVGDPRWDGFTAVHAAVICNQPSILEHILEKGGDPEAATRLGWTPMMITKGIFMANSKKEFPVAAEILEEAIAKKHAQ